MITNITDDFDEEKNVLKRESFKEISFDAKYDGLISKCGEYSRDFYQGVLDIRKLVNELKSNKTKGTFFFNYLDYIKKPT